ncbi:MAG: leucyl aminopeptidase [Proteobacteria bacterium]|nr:leucyl aminopeptidase [Pseudomonadota bacterium]
MTQLIIQEKNLKELTDNIIIFCDIDKNLLAQAQMLDEELESKISTYLNFAEFSGDQNEITHFNMIDNKGLKNIYIMSLGDTSKLSNKEIYMAGIKLTKRLAADKVRVLSMLNEGTLTLEQTKGLISAMAWNSYEFNEWKTDSKDTKLLEISLQVEKKQIAKFEENFNEVEKLHSAIKLTRDLVNRPGNIVTPEYLAEKATELKSFGVKTEVLNQKKLEKLGLNLLLNVGKGSENEPQLVIMKYLGAGNGAKTHALVGKGITFDTGGYSLKTTPNMKEMKSDMSGAAATLGTIKALAELKAPVNVIGVMACAENMISSKAVKVSDIIKSYNGLTVEVNNTDAEGRLVLADALSYIIKNCKIDEVVDIATLTSACMVALGAEYAGVMGYDQAIIEELKTAGNQTNEPLWQLPMGKEYAEMLKSDHADVSNVSSSPYADSTSAGEFLYKFVEEKPWAHIDMSGVAFAGKISGNYSSNGIKGATGFGVRLMTQYYLNKIEHDKAIKMKQS